MDYFGKYDIFRDPVHGFIKVYEAERDLINTRAFQRLRRIKQLALTHYVYHGATHTRFGHSLGVMEVADRVFDIVINKDKYGDGILEWAGNEDEVRRKRVLLRLVALLHDLGHAPFSHVGERLLPKDTSHELMAAAIVREDSEIGQILDQVGVVNREDIALFFEGTKLDQLVQQICMGPLDADKIDYLLRDSLYTGVQYGRFDADRLLHMMCAVVHQCIEDPTLGIEQGGVQAVEAMMLARFSMFEQVYFHRIRRIYDIHLIDFLKSALPGGVFPINSNEYLNYDDLLFESRFGSSPPAEINTAGTVTVLRDRKHFKVIRETARYPLQVQIKVFRRNFEDLSHRFDGLKMDSVEEAPYKWTVEDNLIFVRTKNGLCEELIQHGTYLDSLKPIKIFRIYSPREIFSDVLRESENMKWE